MAKKKEITGTIKLQIMGGQATPAPPVGPALGARGIPIGDFVKQFNDATAKRRGEVVPVVISVWSDRSFTFELKEPPVAALIKDAAKMKKGASTPGPLTKEATLTSEQVKEIAQRKSPELTAHTVEAAMRIVAGQARSMGVVVED